MTVCGHLFLFSVPYKYMENPQVSREYKSLRDTPTCSLLHSTWNTEISVRSSEATLSCVCVWGGISREGRDKHTAPGATLGERLTNKVTNMLL